MNLLFRLLAGFLNLLPFLLRAQGGVFTDPHHLLVGGSVNAPDLLQCGFRHTRLLETRRLAAAPPNARSGCNTRRRPPLLSLGQYGWGEKNNRQGSKHS
jgi:hypothetical protein